MKRTVLFIILVTLVLAASACNGMKLTLPDGFEKNEIEAKCREIVGCAAAKEYDEIILMLRADLIPLISAKDLEEGWSPVYNRIGAFSEITAITYLGQADPDTKEVYAVAAIVCKHENGTATYTLSFNKNLELVGLFMR